MARNARGELEALDERLNLPAELVVGPTVKMNAVVPLLQRRRVSLDFVSADVAGGDGRGLRPASRGA
jgi:hypothetical protein